jgi:HEAT repeat protein
MRISFRTFHAGVAAAFALSMFSGCALQIPIKDPVPSKIAYTATSAAPVTLNFKDQRIGTARTEPAGGRLTTNLSYNDKPFEPVPWLAQHTVSEMKARGLPVSLGNGESGGTDVLIQRLRVENHRASGFSPLVTFTLLRADVVTPRGTQRIAAFIKRGKVPIMTMGEVVDPTFNDPLHVLTKELAAKLNQQLFGQSISDAQLATLVAKVNENASRDNDAYIDVYQVGFGNNPKAVPDLVKWASHANEYVRLAAISSLGILKANDQFDFLSKIYQSDKIWQDRAMALKAIGDLGTPAARAYLEGVRSKLVGNADNEAVWTRLVLDLYL